MSHRYDLKEQIDTLESINGEGTELVTITVPSGKSLTSIRERIAQEYAGAENIKSDRTRDRVQQALKRIQRVLRRYTETPENGLVVYAGVVDGELTSYVFDDLPAPVTESTYRCDDTFDLTPLIEAVAPSETFGLLVVERGEAALGRLVGERVIPKRSFESQVMGKTRAGGQSAQRFKRERERQEHEFFQEVAETARDVFLDDDDPVSGMVVGGTLATAQKFLSGGYLDHRLRDRVLGTHAVEYANEQGLQQLVERSEEQLLDAEQQETREHMEEFMSRLREGETVAYGIQEVEQALEFGAVDNLLVASTLSRERRDELEQKTTQQGGETYMIPEDTERESRFADTFDGVGALLRFPVN